jgi:hypothetical protein
MGRLFNFHTKPIPICRTVEPESISDAMSRSYAPRGLPTNPMARQRQLFNHRKDDYVLCPLLAGGLLLHRSYQTIMSRHRLLRRMCTLSRPLSNVGGRPTPTPKLSNDYVSASSTSSYVHSITSFVQCWRTAYSYVEAIKRLCLGIVYFIVCTLYGILWLHAIIRYRYRGIPTLETRILNEDSDEKGRVTIKGGRRD